MGYSRSAGCSLELVGEPIRTLWYGSAYHPATASWAALWGSGNVRPLQLHHAPNLRPTTPQRQDRWRKCAALIALKVAKISASGEDC